MKIAIATDHNGIKEKQQIVEHLKQYQWIDCSKQNYDTDDYPDFAFKVCNKIITNQSDIGVLLCGTGIGMSIAANKVKGIRCAHCSTKEQAHLAKEHNNANIIALSYKQDINQLIEMIQEFITTTPSTEERHQRRINKIIKYENGEYNEL